MLMRTCSIALTVGVLLAISPAQAQDETANLPAPASTLAADNADNLLDSGSGIVRDTPAVLAVVAANPGREMVICLAGCKSGHGSILWHRPRLVETVDGTGTDAAAPKTRVWVAASAKDGLRAAFGGVAAQAARIAGAATSPRS